MEESRKKSILPILGLVLVVILIVSLASYAYWQITKEQPNRNIVSSACLDISFSGSNDIDLENAWPISDEEGAETTPYTFTITNNCDDPINYQVALESLAAEDGESTNYLDYGYLKVKLNDNEATLYEDLTAITPESGIRDTKELTHHTLAGKGSITYNLRLWIDGDTPLQNEDESYNTEKFFYGKVKVIAGPNVKGDVPLKLLSDPNTPDVTLSNIHVGDRVGYESEQFYVIGIDGDNVKLLSRYLLNVGWNPNPNVPLGLQSAELGYTRPSLTSWVSEEYGYEGEDCWCEGEEDEETGECLKLSDVYCEPSGLINYYGVVPFSDDTYWWDTFNNTWLSPYSQNSFVYNDQSNVKQYVDSYVNTLQTMGLNVTSGTLLSLEELSTLCNTNITTYRNYSNQCPNYIFETTYWLGNVYDDDVLGVHAGGVVNFGYDYDDNGGGGVRPVITVSLS